MIANIKKQKQEDMRSDNKKQQVTIVEVEFCSNCDSHLFTVRHQQHKYFSHFDAIRKKLQEQRITVKKRPVPENLYKKSPYCPSNVYYRVETNEVVYFPEIGSFQVYFQSKKIFSKLETLKWPSPEGIALEIQKMLQDSKKKIQVSPEPQILDKSADEQSSTKKQFILQPQNKRQQFRIKSKQPDEHLSFRYSIDRRNLFRKPENNYLNRKSMTARNQSVSESTSRTNRTVLIQKRSANEEEVSPITEEAKNKQLTDEAVLQMYRKNPIKNASDETEKTETHGNLPQIPKKTRKNQGQGNIYLQPIFPKSNINLQNYTRQKQIMANKIHEQRKSYEASKQFKKQMDDKATYQQARKGLVLKAKFNENCNELLKNKEDKKELAKIKQATEQNQIRNKDNQVAQAEKKSAEDLLKIKQSKVSKAQKASSNAHLDKKSEKQEANEHALVPEKAEESMIGHAIQKETPNEEVSLLPKTENTKQKQSTVIKSQKQKHQESAGDIAQKKPAQNQQQLLPIEKQQPQDKKNEQIKQEEAQQQAYEGQFEEEQEKRQDDRQNEVNIAQGQKPEEPQNESVPHDLPVQAKRQDDKEYENEQFDKEQQQVKKVEKNVVDTEDMAQLINETEALQPDSA